jgi:hypothetical protein
MINPVLGNNCYVGSMSNPINLALTPATTEPLPPNTLITSVIPQLNFDEAAHILTLTNGVYVDNSFGGPGRQRLRADLLWIHPVSINGLVNSSSDLPAPAGTNETRQNVNTVLAESRFVYP